MGVTKKRKAKINSWGPSPRRRSNKAVKHNKVTIRDNDQNNAVGPRVKLGLFKAKILPEFITGHLKTSQEQTGEGIPCGLFCRGWSWVCRTPWRRGLPRFARPWGPQAPGAGPPRTNGDWTDPFSWACRYRAGALSAKASSKGCRMRRRRALTTWSRCAARPTQPPLPRACTSSWDRTSCRLACRRHRPSCYPYRLPSWARRLNGASVGGHDDRYGCAAPRCATASDPESPESPSVRCRYRRRAHSTNQLRYQNQPFSWRPSRATFHKSSNVPWVDMNSFHVNLKLPKEKNWTQPLSVDNATNWKERNWEDN